MPIGDVAAVCELTEQALRKHLRSLPARGLCATTVAALAAAQRLPEPPHLAAVAHRACPPPAVRAARPGHLTAVNAAKGSSSWGLARNPFRRSELYAFTYTSGLHRSVIIALAAGDDPLYRKGIAQNSLCPPPVLEQLAHDPDDDVRDAAAHSLRRCCCDEPSGQSCEAVKTTTESTDTYLESALKDYELPVSLSLLTT